MPKRLRDPPTVGGAADSSPESGTYR